MSLLIGMARLCAALGLAFAALAADDQTPAKVRNKLIQSLNDRDFFRVGKCREISDFFLTQNGLPGLNQAKSVKGVRGEIDRSRSQLNFPNFTDSLTRQRQPLEWVSVAAGVKGSRWLLSVLQKREVLSAAGKSIVVHLTSEFHFDMGKDGECRFHQLGFLLNENGIQSVGRVLSVEDCLDTLSGAPETDQTALGARFGLQTLRKDCSIGLRYAKPPTVSI